MFRSFFKIRLSVGHGLLAAVLSVSPHAQAMAQAGKTLTSFENVCLQEASRAEARHGIPKGLLQSITRVESGRKTVTGDFMPWAWTLNDREGLFFDDRESCLPIDEGRCGPGAQRRCRLHVHQHEMAFRGFRNWPTCSTRPRTPTMRRILLDLHEAHQSWDDGQALPFRRAGKECRLSSTRTGGARTLPRGGHAGAIRHDVAPAATDEPDSTELALVTRPVTRPAPPAVPAVAPVPVPPAPAPTEAGSAVLDRAAAAAELRPEKPVGGVAAPAPFLDSQPNLAPHRARVEHFRRLLSRDPG